ncbi:MAG TPA: hypothetical protein VF962_04155, partial [Gemmatimonadaceae bacterium]
DKTLETMAVRIRARAIRRCGELLKEIPAKAHRPQKGGEPPPHHSERAQAVKDAGLSPDQAKDALRVAKVPAGEFEEAVESETPPTISELAERGTQKKAGALVDIEGRDPEEYNRALLFNGALKELATAAKEIAPKMVFRGSVPRHYERMRDNASFLLEWLNRLRELLETHR